MSVLTDPVFGPLLAVALVAACASDLRWRRVPNALNAGVAAAGLAWQARNAQWAGLADGALGMTVAFVLVIAPFAVRLYRGGDAKLVIALGAWLGPAAAAWAFLWGVALGGLLAIGLFLTGGRDLRARVARSLKLAAGTASLPAVETDRASAQHVPMALAFSGGALIALLWGST